MRQIKRWDRVIIIVTPALVLGLFFFGRNAVNGLDQDNELIDRGQQVANCTGRVSDLGNEALFDAVGAQLDSVAELYDQLDALQANQPVDLTEAHDAIEAGQEQVLYGKQLSRLRRQLRNIADDLIAEGRTDVDCPAPPDPP
jgi:hypothetical protein